MTGKRHGENHFTVSRKITMTQTLECCSMFISLHHICFNGRFLPKHGVASFTTRSIFSAFSAKKLQGQAA